MGVLSCDMPVVSCGVLAGVGALSRPEGSIFAKSKPFKVRQGGKSAPGYCGESLGLLDIDNLASLLIPLITSRIVIVLYA